MTEEEYSNKLDRAFKQYLYEYPYAHPVQDHIHFESGYRAGLEEYKLLKQHQREQELEADYNKVCVAFFKLEQKYFALRDKPHPTLPEMELEIECLKQEAMEAEETEKRLRTEIEKLEKVNRWQPIDDWHEDDGSCIFMFFKDGEFYELSDFSPITFNAEGESFNDLYGDCQKIYFKQLNTKAEDFPDDPCTHTKCK